jgi:hypothetical protein
MKKYSWLVGLENYEPFIGLETGRAADPGDNSRFQYISG